VTGCQRLRVLFVSRGWPWGGAERSLLTLVKELKETADIDPVVACEPGSRLSVACTDTGVEVIPIPFVIRGREQSSISRWKEVAGMIWAGWIIGCYARSHGIRLFHANGMRACLPTQIAARLSGIPWIFHARDYPNRPRLVRWLSWGASKAIVPSRFMADALHQVVGIAEDKIEIIPNAVDPPPGLDKPATEILKAVPEGKRFITMIAQIVPWKRQDLFLEAAALLCKDYDDLHFLVVGSDLWGRNRAYEESLHERAGRSDLKGRVTFLGEVKEIGSILRISSVFVLPSEREPFGRVVVEAWWAGVPVVVSDDGGPAEIVDDGKNGLQFMCGSHRDLSDKVGIFLGSPQSDTIVKSDAKRTVEEYNHPSQVEKNFKILHSILGGK